MIDEPETEIGPHTQVSHEQDGRVLSGVGISPDRLAETMERHAPPEPKTEKPLGTGEAPQPAVAGTPDTPAAPVSRGRQRFADLTRERDEARKVADEARAERERIAKDFEAFKAAQAAPPKAEPAARKEPDAPKKFPDFEEWSKTNTPEGSTPDWYAYDDAKYAWRVEQQRESARAEIRAELEAERRQAAFNDTVRASQDRGRKAYPDFDGLLQANGKNVQMDMSRIQFIVEHPQSEHIQYAILKDAALAKRLDTASDYEFGALIASLAPAERAAKPAAPTWTPPPAPHPSVGASSPTTAKASSEHAKEGNFDAYRAKRAAERGVKPRY